MRKSHRLSTDPIAWDFAALRTPDGYVERAWAAGRTLARPVALVTNEEDAEKLLNALKTQEEGPLRQMAAGLSAARFAAHLRSVGGLFLPLAGRPAVQCDLAAPAYACGLYRTASTVNVTNRAAVTALVSQWGYLGVGPDPDTSPLPMEVSLVLRHVDSFAAVAHELEAFQASLRQLERLKGRRSAGSEWREFSRSLDGRLKSLHPTIRWVPETGPMPAWIVETPRDLLWATLWDLATRGGRLRRCKHCQILFPADDPRKVFCAITCTNRASAARWYRQKGRRLRQARRPQRKGQR